MKRRLCFSLLKPGEMEKAEQEVGGGFGFLAGDSAPCPHHHRPPFLSPNRSLSAAIGGFQILVSSPQGMAAEEPNDRLFGRQRSVHEILGGGIAADVILWRRKNITISVLVGVISAWTLFELSGYTLLSFVSSVLFLLVSILFVWGKTASILNRPQPPIPTLYFSEEIVNETAAFLRCFMNEILSGFNDIAFGKDSKLFVKVAVCLGLTSFVGSLTDFITLGYICLRRHFYLKSLTYF